MTKRFYVIFAALAALGLFLAACSTPTQKVTLIAEDIMWSMDEINVKVNQPLEITLINQGALDHDFTIEELGVDVLLSPGDQQVVNVTIDHAGTIRYICSIPGHEEAGMWGNIVVSE